MCLEQNKLRMMTGNQNHQPIEVWIQNHTFQYYFGPADLPLTLLLAVDGPSADGASCEADGASCGADGPVWKRGQVCPCFWLW